jgi:hypothetical protein
MPRLPLLLATLLWLAACGSSRPRVQASSPFEPVHARFFDDAVDFIREPVALGGQWATDWDEELRGRVGYADTIAIVKVETLRTSVDVERRRTYHLVCAADRVLRGELPDENRIEVRVAEGAAWWRASTCSSSSGPRRATTSLHAGTCLRPAPGRAATSAAC